MVGSASGQGFYLNSGYPNTGKDEKIALPSGGVSPNPERDIGNGLDVRFCFSLFENFFSGQE